MYIPDKFLLWVVKMLIVLALFSLSMSLLNIVPFYVQLNHVANDLVMRSAVNNYVLKREVQGVVEERFGSGTLLGDLISQENRNKTDSANRYGNGVFVYGRVSSDPKEVFPRDPAGCEPGYGCSRYSPSNGRTLIFDKQSFNPKQLISDSVGLASSQKDADDFKAAKGAQRGDTVGIRVESKLRGTIFLIGVERNFEIPIAVEKTSPAMYHYPYLYDI